MRTCLVLLSVFTGFFANAQEVTGIWRGHFRSSDIYQRYTSEDDRYKMEVQIAQQSKAFKAVTYSYKTTIFYGKADANGSVDFQTKKVLLKELKIVELKMAAGDACTMTCYMQYTKLGDDEFLQGTYTSVNTRDSSDCGRGVIFLHKVPTSDFYKEPFVEKREEELAAKKNEPKASAANPPVEKKAGPKPLTPSVAATKKTKPVTKPATTHPSSSQLAKTSPKASNTTKAPEKNLTKKNLEQHQIETVKKDSIMTVEKKAIPIPLPRELAGRTNELVKSLTVNTPDIQLYIYDDGVVDNDTVSVYFDNKLIIHNARLTTQPLIAKIHLDDTSPTHELIMAAENLGEIPPNTSLMVVKAGDKRYEVRIVSTEQKNAIIVFKYEKPE